MVSAVGLEEKLHIFAGLKCRSIGAPESVTKSGIVLTT